MQKLERLIQVAKLQGHLVMIETKQGGSKELPLSILWDALENVEFFIFSPTSGEPIDHTKEDTEIREFIEIDTPFPSVYCEIEDSLLTVSRLTDKIELNTLCFIAVEIAPKQIGFISLVESMGKPYVIFGPNYDLVYRDLLNRLSTEEVGRMPIGKRKLKLKNEFKTVNLVTYISKKRASRASMAWGGREIDYSHRFSVRGHWRKFSGMGKDRAGNRVIEGFTWVSEHIRGPEDALLIPKIRKIT